MIKILHITNWYPNFWNQKEALFIKEHFKLCEKHITQELWHIQVCNQGSFFKIHYGDYSLREHYLILNTRIKIWRLKELLSLGLLVLLRIRLGWCSWKLVNVHIAYPLLRFPKIFKRLFGRNLVITEHWSAYRSNFYLAEKTKAKKRIQNMFHHKIPVIAVSQALMKNIICFADTDSFQQFIVPNVVDPALFYPCTSRNQSNMPIFLMVAFWAPIKRPLLAMLAFAEILAVVPDAQLRIVGYGQQWSDMKIFVKDKGLDGSISLLGPLDKSAIADEMRKTDGFIHASEYETFSVVCAEALCCGVPVIASNVGGIPEFINSLNGILVENNPESWMEALQLFLKNGETWDREQISRNATAMFRPEVVGSQLSEVYQCCAKAGAIF